MEKNSCGDVDLPLHFPLFSEDVLIQILVCLPVKSLLQFKSVCKSWRELIQSSFFIDLHINTTLNSSSSSSKFGAFIIQTMEYYSRRDEYLELEIKLFKLSSSGSGDGDGDGTSEDKDEDDDDDDDDDEKKKMVFKVDVLEFSPFYKDFMLTAALRMVGSCNGIICLHNPDVIMDHHSRGYRKHQHDPDDLRDVYFWNPATRQFKILPKPIPIEERQYYIGNRSLVDFVAFGLDVKTKDYKVMRTTATTILTDDEGCCIYRVQVYSLRTDSWRLLEGIHYLPVMPDHRMSPSHHGIYMNGSYFFVARRKLVFGRKDWIWMMLSFDFTKEIFTTMELPDDNIPVLSCVDEKLAVFTTRDGGYDIWVLKLNEQHGSVVVVVNKKSWTKLHSFQVKSIGNPYTQPRCISNNGEFALISTEKNQLQLFNLVTKEAIKDFTIGYGVLRADVHQESLVSIMSLP